MKMDNQILVKNRFWFLLPVAMIFVLIAFFMLFGPRAAALKAWSDAKANDDQFKSLASAKIRSEENIRKTAEERLRAEQEKLDLWVKFYDMQNRIVRIPEPPPAKPEQPAATGPGVRNPTGETKVAEPILRLGKIDPAAPFEPLIRWPRTRNVDMNEISFPVKIGGEEVLRRIKDLDFMEPIPSDKLDKFPAAFESVYPEMLKAIDWVDETKGYGAVRALDSQANRPGQGKPFRTSRDAAFDLLIKNSRADNLKPVNYQEAWTLLEDAAVKRELLIAIAEVNKLMSDMLPEWEEKLFFPQVTMPGDKSKDKAGDPKQPVGNPPAATTPAVPTKPAATTTKPDTRPASAPSTRPGEGKDPTETKIVQLDRRVFQNWYWLTFDHWSYYGPKWTIDDTGKFVLERKPEKLAPVWNTQAVWKLDLEVVKVPERKVDDKTEPAKLLLQGLAFNEGTDPNVRVPDCRLEVFFADIYDREIKTSQPVYIDDAGDLSPSKRDEETGRLKGKELKPIELPRELLDVKYGVLRIARIARKMDKTLAENKDVRYLDQKRTWNRGWLMDLRLVQTSTPQNSFILEGTVFNRTPRQQRPAVYVLQLRTDANRIVTHRFRVPGPIIDSGEERQFKLVVNELDSSRDPDEPKSKINEAIVAIESVQQELDWRTVPVKRIDAIETGRLAHEHSNRKRVEDPGLHPYPFANKTGPGTALPEGDKDKAPAAPPPDGGAPPTAPGEAPRPASNLPPTNNNVDWLRYNGAPTTEVRRLPIAVIVIIDEAYMNELMTSLANSRLRIQVTMAVWNHLQWPWEEPLWQTATTAEPGPPPRPGSTQPGTAPTRPKYDESLSVVKLQVYGVASIYESPDAHDAREKLRKQAASEKPAR